MRDMSESDKKAQKRKVVVVGAGGAGLASAVAALQANADIDCTVLEVRAEYGGVTAIATGTVRACDTRMQKEVGRLKVTKEDAIKQYLEFGKHGQDLNMLEIHMGKSSDAIDWLLSLGCKIDLLSDYRHQSRPWKEGLPGGTGLTEVLFREAEKLGAKFQFETRANELVMQDGKITAVKALTKNGSTVTFEADAVVLADGGYWGAAEGEFDCDIPDHLRNVILISRGAYSQGGKGDAARMAEAIGAELQDMDKLEYTAQCYVNDKGKCSESGGSATLWSDASGIILNQNLERFVNEDYCFAKEKLTDGVAEELERRQERFFWTVWDEKSREDAWRIGYYIEDGYIGKGFIVVGNTLQELADKMKVEPGKLASAIKQYNQYFEQGLEKDPLCGRDLKREKVHPLLKPPFYAMRCGIQCSNRRGGIAADAMTHVLDKKKQPIPGLYAAGSSMNSVLFDGLGWLGGTGLTACFVWGRIAGTNAALGK